MDDHSAVAFGTMLALLVGVWVMIDANKRGKSGIVSFHQAAIERFTKCAAMRRLHWEVD
jgi:hypothetical protein